MHVDIWSDLVCPWCYVGKRRFDRALAGFEHRTDVTVRHRAYLLYSSHPRGASVDRREMLMSKYALSADQADAMNAGMEATAAAEGLTYRLQGGVTGNTFDAHQLVMLGRERGIEDAVLERLFLAFFTEQRSIFSHDSLIELGADAGLDRSEATRVLRDNVHAGAVEADLAEARAIPVTGVPFFVLDDRYAVSGAQQPAILAQALTRAWDDARSPASVPRL